MSSHITDHAVYARIFVFFCKKQKTEIVWLLIISSEMISWRCTKSCRLHFASLHRNGLWPITLLHDSRTVLHVIRAPYWRLRSDMRLHFALVIPVKFSGAMGEMCLSRFCARTRIQTMTYTCGRHSTVRRIPVRVAKKKDNGKIPDLPTTVGHLWNEWIRVLCRSR